MGRDIVRQNVTEISPIQLTAIVALVGGSSVTDAAGRAGVDRTTLHRWLSGDALFVAELNRAKHEAQETIRAELRATAADAVQALRTILQNSFTPAAVRLKAALAVLDGVGAMGPEMIGPSDPVEVERKWREGQEVNDLLRMLGS